MYVNYVTMCDYRQHLVGTWSVENLKDLTVSHFYIKLHPFTSDLNVILSVANGSN